MLNILLTVTIKGAHHCLDDTNMQAKSSYVNSGKMMRGNTFNSDGKRLKTTVGFTLRSELGICAAVSK
ncbi:MAG: hypothetical protein BGP15_15830 [Sphingobacterium sp. 40-24]|nr:MAG: hypothetical protein BGP15_15830 [Sphingobacterium sp. 40-24]